MSSRQNGKKKKAYRPMVATKVSKTDETEIPADDPGRQYAEKAETAPVKKVKADRPGSRREKATERQKAWVVYRDEKRKAGEKISFTERWRIRKSQRSREALVLTARMFGWLAYVVAAYIVIQMLCFSFFPLLGGFMLRVTAAGVNDDMSYFIAAFVVPMTFMVLLTAKVTWFVLVGVARWLNRQINEFRDDLGLGKEEN